MFLIALWMLIKKLTVRVKGAKLNQQKSQLPCSIFSHMFLFLNDYIDCQGTYLGPMAGLQLPVTSQSDISSPALVLSSTDDMLAQFKYNSKYTWF